ncbi:MAG TPA: cyclic nucleotide-binding domain-containing protein [Blastocatellia bacterium]|nr:cyclic nucleotide-binding domain-containing protein [Blastocatellia bacterium]
MPREHKSRRNVLDAIKSIPSLADLLATHDGHFDYEIDLEVVVYGRNYNGKKVGPYVRLFTFDPGEEIVKQGDWGGNSFYVVVEGSAEVFVHEQPAGASFKVAEIGPGVQFGEASVLAGVPRNATVKAPPGGVTKILEVQRPALRLLRKLPKFSEALDKTYRKHGRDSVLEQLKDQTGLSQEMTAELGALSRFRVYTKNHVLIREGGPMDYLYILKEGWIRRTVEKTSGPEAEDFLGKGHCFGIEGVMKGGKWPYSVTLMDRAEVLEIPISKLRQHVALRGEIASLLGRYAPPGLGTNDAAYKPAVRQQVRSAQESLIETGLVDATNLLVMDMDLCVRCGNCSLACHKVHGQSRLLRRGVHVTRLKRPAAGATQSLLSPQVCMHCKDPECLTGCPTGAIGRFGVGQIDIDPKTCIGCGDCATQCPYDAITMVPRKPAASASAAGLLNRVRDLLRIAPEPLPAAVEQTDDLLAVKCNLCESTTMNPAGSQTRAYSCEENCPTGALARVNPRAYFSETGKIEGLLLVDSNHAVGRNIHKSDPASKALNIAGVILIGLLGAAAILGLREFGMGKRIIWFLNMRWITGLAGLIGIAGVMTYPVRRQIYVKRRWPLRYWLLVHSYLGVIAGIMILLHGGTDSGGLLTTALMVSFDLTVLTGLLGAFLYLTVPRMLTRIEGSPLLIDDLKARRTELWEELSAIQGSASPALVEVIKKRLLPRIVSAGFLIQQYLRPRSLEQSIELAGKALIREAESLEPRDRQDFLRTIEVCVTARRAEALIYLHRLLKLWLPPHVVFTSLMLALMAVHVVQVIVYYSS